MNILDREHREKIRIHLEEVDRENHEMKQLITMAYFVGGIYDGKYMTEWQIEQEYGNGRHSADYSESRKRGGCVPFAVLDNTPCVDGYLEPMWDNGMLRYETQEVYNLLSR